ISDIPGALREQPACRLGETVAFDCRAGTMKTESHIKTCGWCISFKPNKSISPFAGGWWIGDGKCTFPKTDTRFTVTGDTCENFKKNQMAIGDS
ncbi:unnamed protein product, partial [marine sediment metagenome]